MDPFYDLSIEKINGIGEKRARLFEKLGIVSVGDLIRFYPRAYEDWSVIRRIADVEVGEVCCVSGRLQYDMGTRFLQGGRFVSTTRIEDDTAFLSIAFFNNQYISNMLKKNNEYLFYGKVTQGASGKEMINPQFQPFGASIPIRPIYSQVAGLTSRHIESAVKNAVGMMPQTLEDPLTEKLRRRYDLIDLRSALKSIHFPSSTENIDDARRRLIFEELLVLELGMLSVKSMTENHSSVRITHDCTDEFASLLPFKLTGAQRRAIDDCIGDISAGSKAMNRLVQGDVGSGKTMVAAAVAYSCVKSGFQAAMMAPTEILAKQHYENFEKLLSPVGVNVKLLTGSMTPKQKRETVEQLAVGEIDLLVGTHALISDNVVFKALGLVITDEQHRFGVRQRATLLAKGESPHLLVMSATPIPRTLALIVYGDLDISIIDELPPGRQQIETLLIDSTIRKRAFGFLKKNIDEGRQCYIVCPAVENTDTGLAGVEEYAAAISHEDFKEYRVAVLHGKMKPAEKECVMADFSSGKTDILVSTTVIEVGVDVPNATIMLIENAERFGLSQLHQLRGRVGRGSFKSYCILLSDAQGAIAITRLKVLKSTCDGFKIADEDLRLRGSGDFFGSRQHGLPELKIADLVENGDILREARAAADEIMDDYLNEDHIEYEGLRKEVRSLFDNVGEQLN